MNNYETPEVSVITLELENAVLNASSESYDDRQNYGGEWS